MKISPKVLYPLLVVLGIGLGIGGVLVYNWKFVQAPPPSSSGLPSLPPPTDQTQTQLPPSVVNVPTSTPDVTSSEATTTTVPVLTGPLVTLNISWHAPQKVTMEEAIGGASRATLQPDEYSGLVTAASSTKDSGIAFFDLGTVNGGAYEGWHYIYWETGSCDPGGCVSFIILRSPDGKTIKGVKVDPELEWFPEVAYLTKIFTMGNFSIPSLTPPPSTLTLQNGRVLQLTNLYLSMFGSGVRYDDVLNGVDIGKSPIGKTKDGLIVYQTDKSKGCVYLFGNDGTPYAYVSIIPMKEGGTPSGTSTQPDIAWGQSVDTHVKNFQYNYGEVGGCGVGSCVEVVSDADVGPVSGLKQVGATVENDPVYVPTDPASNSLVKDVYDSWYVPDAKVKPSMAEFLKAEPMPIFFWKDAFGRWVRYLSVNAMPMTECGKPVIYLYPPKTEAVSVQLPSFIDVTKSEPAYPSRGWNVMAQPNGHLTTNGFSYGSLYWEGNGATYEKPTTGFVVKDGEVDAFLQKTLAAYGLNEKESQEFRDFWAPKMVGAPYYRVSFLTDAWSRSVPLFVSPRPSTSIRIFMDWQKLSAPISIQSPTITTPHRNGFTLVEWGGLLYH